MVTIETERLTLVACPAQVARAAYQGRRHAEALLGVRLHDQWPGEDIRAFLPIYAQQLEYDATLLGWGIWLMVERADRVVIGDVGFKGKPGGRGIVDLGYGVVPAYRQQGYAYEAARAMRDWAFADAAVQRVTADCLPDNFASARILEKLGMRRTGTSESGLLTWEIARPT